MNFFSAFDGISAAAVALLPLGYKCVGVSEIDPHCIKLVNEKYNFRNYGNFSDWKSWGKIEADMVIGGSPCTAFSHLGRRGGTSDPAGRLTLDFTNFICKNTPRYFLLENVPQILSIEQGRLFRWMLAKFTQRGYGVAWRILNSRYFGVAQSRRRVFAVGCLGDSTSAGKILFEAETMPIPTMEIQRAGQENTSTSAFGDYKNSRKQGRMDTHAECHRERYRQNNTALGTLTCQLDSGIEQVNLIVIDNNRPRYLTPLECERLQGFPDGYTEGFSDTTRYKMIGNSMPVPVIRWLGARILATEQGATEWSKAG